MYIGVHIKDTGTILLYIIVGPFAKLEYGDTLVNISLNELEEFLSFFFFFFNNENATVGCNYQESMPSRVSKSLLSMVHREDLYANILA